MAQANKVLVSGLGAVSGLGINVSTNWENLITGTSSVRDLSSEVNHLFANSDSPPQILGSRPQTLDVPDYLLSEKEKDRFDRFIHMGLMAMDEALQDASITNSDRPLELASLLDPEKVGCILGVGMGGFPAIEAEHAQFVQAGLNAGRPRTSPFFITSLIPNMITGLASIRWNFFGPNFTTCSACASSGHAIETATRMIRSGELDMVITGGVEAVITEFTNAGFRTMRALSKRKVEPHQASCPFSKDRDGFVMGEGSGVLILESEASWERRHKQNPNLKCYGEVLGTGSSSDAHHIAAPESEGRGAARCMRSALKNANLDPSQIGYINAHGTSTPLGDLAETLAIKNVFEKHAYQLSISSTKSMTGHLLGAASAIESVFSLMALKEQTIPPTINLNNPDEKCDLDYTPNQAVTKKFDYALNNSFGFGGTNSSIIFKRI